MFRRAVLGVAVLFLLPAAAAAATDPPPLISAHGTVDKVTKDTLTIRPRGPTGKFGKNLTFKVTATSRITTLVPQTRAGKLVMTQRDADLKDLRSKQTIAVLYTTLK